MPDASPGAGQPGAGQPGATADALGGVKFAFVAAEKDMSYAPAARSDMEKYRQAVAFLNGGASRRAAALITKAVDGLSADGNLGQLSVTGRDKVSRTAIAYHWILAIMSGRAFEQLTPDDLAAIDHARSIADTGERGDLPDAYAVVCQILDKLQRRAGDAGAFSVDCSTLKKQYRAEIHRHMGAMLAGRITEEGEAALAAEAAAPHLSDERKARAWKYFEQVPAPPRLRTYPDPVFPGQGQLLVTCAVVLCLVAVPLAIGLLQERGVVRAIVLSVVILLASVITIRSRIAELAAMERIADKDSEFGERHVGRYSRPVLAPGIDGPPVNPGDDAAAEKARQARVRIARFSRLVSGQLDEQFATFIPADQTARLRWSKETAGLKDSVGNEMVLLYSDSAGRPGALNWLINWRVREIATAFRAGKLRAYQQQLLPRARAVLGFALGTVVSVVAGGYAAFLVVIQRPVQGAIALVLIGSAVVLVALSRVDIYRVENRRLPADRADAERQHEADLKAYKRWQDAIADPPGDHQLAYWLDLDKIRLNKLFMTQPGMSGQEVLAHATLTEPAPGCVGRRLPYGPPRYSAYKVTIFLLTRAGVRVSSVTLDFLTGAAFDPMRRAFRYDTIMSARLQESGIRYDSASRQATPAPAYPWASGQNGEAAEPDIVRRNIDGSVVLRQDFRLSMEDGEGLRFLVENFESMDPAPSPGSRAQEPDYPEDPVDLLDLALDASGVGSALELLEVVCGHGYPWVQEQIQRRTRPENGELADAGVS